MSSEGQDLSDVDEVWIGDISVAGEEFVEALEAVEQFQETVKELKSELDDMSVGLDREDAMKLIYARNYDLNKSEVEAAFEAVDAFIDEDLDDVAPRIINGEAAGVNLGEAAEVWGDMVRLAEKYGSLNGQTEDDA